MAPVLAELAESKVFKSQLCVTAQHREMLDEAMGIFDIVPDFDLDIMSHDQSLTDVFSLIVKRLAPFLRQECPDLVLVHGDTVTTAAACIASYLSGIPVGHIEAGLRTGNLYDPWPEEGNRKLVASIAKYHFAPTEKSANNLLLEGIPSEKIVISGNSVIDALKGVSKKIDENQDLQKRIRSELSFLDFEKPIVLITGHRRESYGERLDSICRALARVAATFPESQIVYPIHPNPNIKKSVNLWLKGGKNIHVIKPLEYFSFVYLMKKSTVILTDSGGIQEEAPTLGVPVLILRDSTERPEALTLGLTRLIGTDEDVITKALTEILSHSLVKKTGINVYNPFGEGNAAKTIREFLERELCEKNNRS